MPKRDLLARTLPLRVERLTSEGASLLAAGEPTPIHLPHGEVTPDLWEGDELDAFIYPDRQGRLFATRKRPAIELGEARFLQVSALTDFGAFIDWGLAKELFLPKREQTQPIREGDWIPVALLVDDEERVCATMRLAGLLPEGGPCEKGATVEGEAWRNEPGLGLFVIVDHRWVALLPAEEPHRLRRGEKAEFRVARILPDGKVTLTLRGPAFQEADRDARRLLADLTSANPARLGDHSPPEAIRDRYGLSKKAYKRAAGRLIKQGKATIEPSGVLVARKG